MLEGLSYDDVLLVPQLGVLEKRKDADISSFVARDVPVEIPIISAPMPSVTEWRMAGEMTDLGAQAVIHRFQSIDERISHWNRAQKAYVAIGLKDGWEGLLRLHDAGVTRFCLDVAHGHHEQVGRFVEQIKGSDYSDISLMVGNIVTAKGASFLMRAGADALKVGVGPGAACRTREVTGFGVPQLTAIKTVCEQVRNWAEGDPKEWGHVTVIADGGIKSSGDIVKALAAGADTVMIGSLLAGADEAPKPGEYYGNASARINGHRAPEGAEGTVPTTGPVVGMLKKLSWGIRSGISYAGATDISSLRENAQWIRVAPGTALESAVRV